MDPVSMALASTAVGVGGTLFQGVAAAREQKAQAAAETQRANVEAQWNERRALEERTAAQSQAGEEMRQARLAQSRLGAIAGASGSGASDPTVMNLWKGIEGEGRQNAAMATAAGQQAAAGLDYQSALNRWTADQNARIRRASARNTIIGSVFDAAGRGFQSRMSMRYGGGGGGNTAATGYGS